MITLLWILAAILFVVGVVQILQGALVLGVILMVLGAVVGIGMGSRTR